MSETKDIINTGLRGVTIASTKISHVDSDASKLIYRGFLITELAQNTTYEEVVHLLLFEKLPDQAQLKILQQRLASERAIPESLIAAMKTQPKAALPMDILQAAVCMLASHDPDAAKLTKEKAEDMAIKLVAKIPTIVAAWDRIRNGKEPVKPDTKLSHAANFLYMLTGTPPDEQTARDFDICLVLHAEHSFNASTFAAREVASTRAHMYAAVSAAVGSLSGELHGGANSKVMQMLISIGSIDKIENYIHQVLNSGGLIMGLGHAVYKNGDPRALILAPMSKKLGERIHNTQWYEMSTILEEKAKAAFKDQKGIDIYPNVDFYSASVYYSMGIPIDLFTPVFAISRIAGWAAHVIEEQFAGAAPKAALYRPSSKYVGEYCGPVECEFVPMNQR
jgi:citrate synthase